MFAKLLNLILVSFLYNSLIIINHVGILVCTDDLLLLKVNFFLCEELKCLDYILLWCMLSVHKQHRYLACNTWRYAGPGCLSACTTDCWSASIWPSRPTYGQIGHVLVDQLSVG